jgi:hypothetical protein
MRPSWARVVIVEELGVMIEVADAVAFGSSSVSRMKGA